MALQEKYSGLEDSPHCLTIAAGAAQTRMRSAVNTQVVNAACGHCSHSATGHVSGTTPMSFV